MATKHESRNRHRKIIYCTNKTQGRHLDNVASTGR